MIECARENYDAAGMWCRGHAFAQKGNGGSSLRKIFGISDAAAQSGPLDEGLPPPDIYVKRDGSYTLAPNNNSAQHPLFTPVDNSSYVDGSNDRKLGNLNVSRLDHFSQDYDPWYLYGAENAGNLTQNLAPEPWDGVLSAN